MENPCEQMDCPSVDDSIQNQLFSVMGHPTKPRRRYESEGKRRMKESDGDPLILDVCTLLFFFNLVCFSSVIKTEKLHVGTKSVDLDST